MKESLVTRLETLAERFEEVSALLADSEVIADTGRFRDLSREYAELEPVAHRFRDWQQVVTEVADAAALQFDADDEMRTLAAEEHAEKVAEQEALEQELRMLLVPKDPNDACNVFLEVRAGTGGDEAAIFAGDLFRMYSRYAEQRGWRVEILSASEGEHGGYKEVISRVSGENVYARLKFESGAHRVQRVPETESQGRIHTSACTVAILPEAGELEEIEIDKGDLRIDTYRASGAGGQHVNKTDSAVRLTHLPTGIVVECQDERSQHKNKARALSLLAARLNDLAREQREREHSEQRRSLVGSGDRSERIRTYNFPQGRVTDHRINLTLYKLEEIIAGGLDAVIDPLLQEHQAALLADQGEA